MNGIGPKRLNQQDTNLGSAMNDEHDSVLLAAFNEAIADELDDAIRKIRFCIGQLSEDQLWWRPTASMNSIANLILHLCGNIRQWVIAGVGGSPDLRNRPQEFAQRDRIPTNHLLDMLDQVAIDFRKTLEKMTPEELIRQRSIQGFDMSGLQAVIDSIAHFRGHTQEITHMTRVQLGESYEFDFVPGPGQQGGAAS
jgi:uncharacterized damage-inducible protein DinB